MFSFFTVDKTQKMPKIQTFQSFDAIIKKNQYLRNGYENFAKD